VAATAGEALAAGAVVCVSIFGLKRSRYPDNRCLFGQLGQPTWPLRRPTSKITPRRVRNIIPALGFMVRGADYRNIRSKLQADIKSTDVAGLCTKVFDFCIPLPLFELSAVVDIGSHRDIPQGTDRQTCVLDGLL
jgi:hypothetical protein